MLNRRNLFAFVALLLLPAGVNAQWGPISPEADAILKAVAEKHKTIEQCTGDYVIAVFTRVGRKTSMRQARLVFRLTKPNKLRAEVTSGDRHFSIVCDGQKVWTHYRESNKYMVEDAPLDIHGLFVRPMYAKLLEGMSRAITAPFALDPYAALVRNVQSAELVGLENFGKREAHHLLLRFKGNEEMNLWVDRETASILRARLGPEPGKGTITVYAQALPPSANPEVIALPAGYAFVAPADARRANDKNEFLQVELPGTPLHDFELNGLRKEQKWRLSELKGQVVALDFWATWCPPCRAELPKLQEIYQAHKDEGFLLLAINMMEDRGEVSRFLEAHKLSVPVAMDADGEVAGTYDVRGLPTLLLIDKAGRLRHTHVGYRSGMEAQIKREVEALLAEKWPAGDATEEPAESEKPAQDQ